MALNTSGPISLAGSTTGQSIAVELGVSATAQISLNCTNVRTLAGVASGAITMPTNFYGKSSTVTGSQSYTTAGTYTWTAPTGVTSVSVVVVGVGGNPSNNTLKAFGTFYRGGGGGGLAYKNSITVSPGTGYTVSIGAADDVSAPITYFSKACVVSAYGGKKCSAGCKNIGTGGGNGGVGGVSNTGFFGGSGGAGGYSGTGGRGGICTCTTVCSCFPNTCTTLPTAGSGGGGGGGQYSNIRTGAGGVGLFGQGANGAAGYCTVSATGGSGGGSGSGANGGSYGGGAGYGIGCGIPGSGAVRIVYPGTTRKFPSTCVGSP